MLLCNYKCSNGMPCYYESSTDENTGGCCYFHAKVFLEFIDGYYENLISEEHNSSETSKYRWVNLV
jgi:hypothetical protein